ncbi:LysR family transcriptional regulator [Kordiimonas sp. SCSIO 12610]|uniref:LysR family transcriptional regulator n=1 Tax=Kordiimonas sp. SCSIO 12610 TaxID=2829597 RepID=UPI00210C2F3A|nr:LysR family transcriptional regulator [Kordiimonas sp. SCSIO 12610]UTW56555.1 LysR family transcriptional regulator [Kordiimonas sp. SCSIO 12610]
MNWDDIRHFLAVARAGRLSKAAQQLSVNQATVGRRISALESALGSKLFDKSPQGYTLTEAGERLIPVAEQMESATISAFAEMADEEQHFSGTIRLGAPDGVATYLISEGAKSFCERHPNLELQIVASPRTFSLSKREADFTITVSPPNQGRLKVRKISDFHLHLYASKSFIDAHAPIMTTNDIKHLPNVAYIPDLITDKKLDYLPLIDDDIKANITSTSLHVQVNCTLAGAGLCVIPDFIAKRHADLVPILPEQVHFKRSFWLVVHEDYAKLERIKAISDYLTDHVRNHLGALAATK